MIECSTFTMPKARKEHKCDLCGRKIPVGTKYVKFSYKEGGKFFETKLHNRCYSIVQEYSTDECESEWDAWSVIDWLECKLCDACHCERADCDKSVINCYIEIGGTK